MSGSLYQITKYAGLVPRALNILTDLVENVQSWSVRLGQLAIFWIEQGSDQLIDTK